MCVCLSARLQLSAIGPKDTTSSSPPGACIMYNVSASSHLQVGSLFSLFISHTYNGLPAQALSHKKGKGHLLNHSNFKQQ